MRGEKKKSYGWNNEKHGKTYSTSRPFHRLNVEKKKGKNRSKQLTLGRTTSTSINVLKGLQNAIRTKDEGSI